MSQAQIYGTPGNRLRERLRRAVREILCFWLVGVIPIFWKLASPNVPKENTNVAALLISGALCVPAWTFYRLIRFALAR